MALARPLPPLWQTLLPGLNGSVRPVLDLPILQRLSQPFRTLPTPFAALAAPALSLPSFPSLADIWEGILKAVPKKKTSYMKKRIRQNANKGLKDLTSLNRCSACGRVKRAHILCPFCVDAIKTNIFGQLSWGVRRPTRKQKKQLWRQNIFHEAEARTMARDPRKEEKEKVIRHTGWKR